MSLIFKCPSCGSTNNFSCGDFIKTGKKIIRHRQCIDCHRIFGEISGQIIFKSRKPVYGVTKLL